MKDLVVVTVLTRRRVDEHCRQEQEANARGSRAQLADALNQVTGREKERQHTQGSSRC
jgi:hypothetical protein